MKRRGFALWEIVAVICVVLIIVVVSIPVIRFYTPSRENDAPNPHGRCMSNLKQIGLAIRMYSQDYDEKYPLIAVNNIAGANSTYGWADTLQIYLKSTQLLQCPVEGDRPSQIPDPTQKGYTDYWLNLNAAGRDMRIRDNVSSIVVGDGNDGQDSTNSRYHLSSLPAAWQLGKSSPAHRHRGGANYGFADGHVKWLKPDEVTTAPVSAGGYTFAIE